MWTHPVFADSLSDPDVYLPVAIGGLVAAAVITFATVRWARRSRKDDHLPVKAVRPEVDTWEHPEQLYGDQRTSVRRQGTIVPIRIASASFKNGTRSGIVIDRSTGGLRIATQVAVEAGSSIQVLPVDATQGTPWVTVIVRNCKVEKKGYLLGCEFEVTPPWNVLLLFG